MTEQEKYLFDLQGYLTVPDALSPEQLQTFNATLDEHMVAEMGDKSTQRFGGLLHWGQPFLDLLDNPRITPYLENLLGAQFRLDHIYADVIRGGLGPIGAGLHGGGSPYDPAQYYHYRDGKMYSGLLVIAYNLRDVNPGDGGFACVPGSHKANFPFPNEWKNLEELQPCVRPVTGPAGTAILFTEALTHGTLPWRGQDERRTIFYKYSPHHMSWAKKYFDAAEYEGLSDHQRSILEAPSARYK
jgi:ectoine hydroxylase-related dioxygenase (phytanoyl-CoA dioxygenase family)